MKKGWHFHGLKESNFIDTFIEVHIALYELDDDYHESDFYWDGQVRDYINIQKYFDAAVSRVLPNGRTRP